MSSKVFADEPGITTDGLPTERELPDQVGVIVLGGGLAGAAAMLAAAEEGQYAVLLEKLPVLGGSTIRSAGRGGFEVLMLGVGPDGHVASLFPGHPAQQTSDAITVAVHGSPKPPPERVSLTFEAMERSHEVWFLVTGGDKAEAVRDGVEGAPPEVSSAAQVRGTGRTVWFLDEEAASLLRR